MDTIITNTNIDTTNNMQEVNNDAKIRGFELVSENNRVTKKFNTLPLKATKRSGGYDLYCPVDIDIPPQEKVVFSSDIKAYMQPGEILIMAPRSSTGIKHDLMLANTIVIGDCDFYNNETNEGNYAICLRNLKPEMRLVKYKSIHNNAISEYYDIENCIEKNTVHIKAGDRVIQAFFVQTLPADSGESKEERKGGIGSTGK